MVGAASFGRDATRLLKRGRRMRSMVAQCFYFGLFFIEHFVFFYDFCPSIHVLCFRLFGFVLKYKNNKDLFMRISEVMSTVMS